MGSKKKLADDYSKIIKKAEKSSCVGVWDKNDYTVEAEEQLADKNTSKDIKFSERNLRDLVGKSDKIFRNLKIQGTVTEKEFEYFVKKLPI